MNENSVVLITGANSGIGKAISTRLAKTGAVVVMLCRNKERGEKALQEVRSLSGNNNVQLMLCDLASIKSIKDFTLKFKKSFQRLDVLINNAGVVLPGYHKSKDGYELHFAVNHLGHFLLSNELLELILASAPARIINVSSGAHKIGKIHFDDINLEKKYRFWRAYA
ncbi:MAG: SDR family NAD(P)-dependent oxidoreductase, partial [Bacillota bacterium]